MNAYLRPYDSFPAPDGTATLDSEAERVATEFGDAVKGLDDEDLPILQSNTPTVQRVSNTHPRAPSFKPFSSARYAMPDPTLSESGQCVPQFTDSVHTASAGGLYSSDRTVDPTEIEEIEKAEEEDRVQKRQEFLTKPLPTPDSVPFLRGSSNQFRWNVEYQEINELEHGHERDVRTTRLSKEFADVATKYASIIISELCLPYNRKTVKPISNLGVAGGDKYVVQGILFKIAVDAPLSEEPPLYMYGNTMRRDDYAMKAAANELKALCALWMAPVTKVCFPLMTMVDYCGYRTLAVSLLPIDGETIRYGSPDGGISVFSRDPELAAELDSIAEVLKLKKHKVGFPPHDTELSFPGDIEGHLGHDGRYYLIDFARLMPPEVPSSNEKLRAMQGRTVFYQVLRPEHVRFHNKIPLSADAFTAFDTSENAAANRDDVIAVCNDLYDRMIPEYASILDEGVEDLAYFAKYGKAAEAMRENSARRARGEPIIELSELFPQCVLRKLLKYRKMREAMNAVIAHVTTMKLHVRGICLRHLGRLREASKNKTARKLILSAAVARTAKNMAREMMREKMKQLRVPVEQPFVDVVVDILNRLLAFQKDDPFSQELYTRASIAFPRLFNEAERADACVDPEHMDTPLVVHHVLELLNVRLRKAAGKGMNKHLFSVHDPRKRKAECNYLFHFVAEDVERLESVARNLPAVALAEARKGYECVMSETSAPQRKRKLRYSLQTLLHAVNAMPFCPTIGRYFGETLVLAATTTKDRKKRNCMFSNAYDKFSMTVLDSQVQVTENIEQWEVALMKHIELVEKDVADGIVDEYSDGLLEKLREQLKVVRERKGTTPNLVTVCRMMSEGLTLEDLIHTHDG